MGDAFFRLSTQTTRRAASLLAVVAVVVRFWLGWSVMPVPQATENMHVGQTLATEGFFGNPFFVPTGPTAHVAPVYPWIIAGAGLITGDMQLAYRLARTLLMLLIGGLIFLLPRFAEDLGFRREAGLLAGALFCVPLPPVFAWIEVTGQHETVITAASLVVLVWATIRAFAGAASLIWHWILLGIGWAFGMHVAPTLLLPMIALTGALALRGSKPLPLRRLGICGAAFVGAMLPWTVRNAMILGGPVFVRDNFGIEMAMSNADDAGPDMRDNFEPGRSMSRHPYFNAEAAQALKLVGERQYYAILGKQAESWIREHPIQFVKLTLQRVWLFFIPKLGSEYHPHFYYPLVFLWIVGSALLWSRQRMTVLTLNAVILAYALPHFVIQTSVRYSYPVLWLMALFASQALLEAPGVVRGVTRKSNAGDMHGAV